MTALSESDLALIVGALAFASVEWERLAKATPRIDVACRYRDSIIDAKNLSARLLREPVS